MGVKEEADVARPGPHQLCWIQAGSSGLTSVKRVFGGHQRTWGHILPHCQPWGPPPPNSPHTGCPGLRPAWPQGSFWHLPRHCLYWSLGPRFPCLRSTESSGKLSGTQLVSPASCPCGLGTTRQLLLASPRTVPGHVLHHLHGLLPAGCRSGRLPHVLLWGAPDGEWLLAAQGVPRVGQRSSDAMDRAACLPQFLHGSEAVLHSCHPHSAWLASGCPPASRGPHCAPKWACPPVPAPGSHQWACVLCPHSPAWRSCLLRGQEGG